ncbi:diphthine methyltransferase-like [Artemia franciscana]|uniref:diphthine methyltransferase-like n=1 Tax=Artemia franciscana TaxID=6661 RepID=UPI0032DB8A6B
MPEYLFVNASWRLKEVQEQKLILLFLTVLNRCETLKTYQTPLTADCVEFCPIEEYTDFFVCGNYQLENGEKSERIGKLSLHNVSMAPLDPICSVDSDAISAIKFMKSLEQPILASVESSGYFRLWAVSGLEIKYIASKQLCYDILLSCDFYDMQSGVSTSLGALVLLDVSTESLAVKSSWTPHDHEAWIVAFDRKDRNILYSGSDDCCLRMYDTRLSLGKGNLLGKKGDMGITSIQSHPFEDYLQASGR